MELSFKINEFLRDDISIIDNQLIPRGLQVADFRQKQYKEYISLIINEIGKASAEAQGLKCEITSKEKLINTDNRIYLKVDLKKNKAIGYIKVGTKKLFLFDAVGNHHELDPLCVLDFYVHESMQRKGCGRELFDYMIQKERVEPHELAINRPSSKFLSFLNKHYSLMHTIPQNNKFVIFNNFFIGRPIPVDRRQWNYGEEGGYDEQQKQVKYFKTSQQLHPHQQLSLPQQQQQPQQPQQPPQQPQHRPQPQYQQQPKPHEQQQQQPKQQQQRPQQSILHPTPEKPKPHHSRHQQPSPTSTYSHHSHHLSPPYSVANQGDGVYAPFKNIREDEKKLSSSTNFQISNQLANSGKSNDNNQSSNTDNNKYNNNDNCNNITNTNNYNPKQTDTAWNIFGVRGAMSAMTVTSPDHRNPNIRQNNSFY